MVKAP
ncbi:hypothetical protein S40285_09756 [Stachybotrys chlorohalonatus IBT 40285]|jgi:isovaleryl-CoA dehydrogenase